MTSSGKRPLSAAKEMRESLVTATPVEEAVERLRTEVDRAYVEGTSRMVRVDADLRALIKDWERLRARVKELENGLEPFARAANKLGREWRNYESHWDGEKAGLVVLDLRRARALLPSEKEG